MQATIFNVTVVVYKVAVMSSRQTGKLNSGASLLQNNILPIPLDGGGWYILSVEKNMDFLPKFEVFSL